jgi:hypothetical protein
MAESKKTKKDQGLTYCRPDKKGMGRASKTSEKWCSECGHKRRGINHDQGTHHNKKKK